MNKTKQTISIFLILFFLNACSSVVEGLSGNKKKVSDEFLVEKKAPLVLPPSFGELPEPGKKEDENQISTKENNSSIEEIINEDPSVNADTKKDKSNSSIEESIMKIINEKKIKEIDLDETIVEENEEPKKKGFFKRLKSKFKNLEN